VCTSRRCAQSKKPTCTTLGHRRTGYENVQATVWQAPHGLGHCATERAELFDGRLTPVREGLSPSLFGRNAEGKEIRERKLFMGCGRERGRSVNDEGRWRSMSSWSFEFRGSVGLLNKDGGSQLRSNTKWFSHRNCRVPAFCVVGFLDRFLLISLLHIQCLSG
jgi:hypothetical protein